MSDLKCAPLVSHMSQPETTKMFVGGLSWETSIETFTKYFKSYGEITDSVIMKDMAGKPRGFGFVTFKDPKSVGAVLDKDEHWIDGKQVDPKIAEKRGTTSSLNQNHVTLAIPSIAQTKKVFVGGIAPGTTEQDLSRRFDSYGNVTKVEIKVDKESLRPRGFGFLTLDNDESVRQICKDQFFVINGKKVECKLAQDPGSNQDMSTSQNVMNTYPCYTDPVAAYYYYYYSYYGQPYGQYYPYPPYNYTGGEYCQDQRAPNSYFAQAACQGGGGQQQQQQQQSQQQQQQQQLMYYCYCPVQGEVGQQNNGGVSFSRQKNGGNNSSQSRGSNSSGNHY